MIKSLLIITSFGFIISNAEAQITLSSADMPIPTKIIYQANDTLPTISIGIAGINQTWNMPALAQHTHDTSTAMPYSAAPNTAFATASLAIKQGYQDFYGYFKNSPTAMTFLGGGGLVKIQGHLKHINQVNTPAEISCKFPASYDSSFTAHYIKFAKFQYGQVVNGFMIDSIQQKSGVKKTDLVDGWGVLTTPLAGGPYNVLRIKETKISHDTAKAFLFGAWTAVPGGITADSTTTYSWWANGVGAPLVTATMDSAGSVKKVQWLMSLPAEPPLSATVSTSSISCPGLCDGSASATANWGIPPYTYSWNTNPVQHSHTATGLCTGSYTVTITDSLLATATATATIHQPILPVITANGSNLSTSFFALSFQWYLNSIVITGATTSNYTVTQNGSYTVVVSNGSCSDTSAPFIFHTIGISEFPLSNSVSIYPNPVNSQINIQFDATSPMGMTSIKQDVTIEIRNELGQCVKKVLGKSLAKSKNELIIDVADLPSGVYFIQIQNQNNSVNKKFIKQ